MSDFTHLIEAAQAGDRKAAADLLPLVYDELRQLAAAKMAAESSGHTLDATALVHEAYLRLVNQPEVQAIAFANRGHFFAAAAEAMRRLLIDNARRKQTAKHGGGRQRQSLDGLAAPEPDEELLALDEALQQLAAKDPQKAKLVELRYFRPHRDVRKVGRAHQTQLLPLDRRRQPEQALRLR
jgi:RNA polymerase sigma factor (TIGR02999 family)